MQTVPERVAAAVHSGVAALAAPGATAQAAISDATDASTLLLMDMRSFRPGVLCGRMSVVPLAPRQPGRDLLKQPAVAVRVAERRVREVRASERVGEPRGLGLLVDLADLDATAEEILAGGVDVLDRQVHPLKGAGLHRVDARDPLAEVDRARRVGRRHLHQPDVLAE